MHQLLFLLLEVEERMRLVELLHLGKDPLLEFAVTFALRVEWPGVYRRDDFFDAG